MKEEDNKNTGIIDPMSIFLKLKNNEGIIKPLTVPAYVAYRYLQSRGDWPTVDGNEVVDRFLTVIENRVKTDSASKGIFGWVHLNDLHAPLHPTRARSTPIAPEGSLYQYLKWDSYRALQRDRGKYPRVYDSTLRYIDEQIKLIINELQRIGVWDQTALIITGDHGEAFCERGVWAHPQHYMYDEVLRVPFLVRIPSGDSDRTAAPISLAWIHEIVSDLFGTDRFDLPNSSGLSNHADEEKDRVVLSDSITRHGHTVAVRNQEYKYLVHYGSVDYSAPPRALGGLNTEEGYRISSDRGEHDPIDIEEVPESLRKRAQKIRTSPEELVAIDERSIFSDERRRQLQNLGYID